MWCTWMRSLTRILRRCPAATSLCARARLSRHHHWAAPSCLVSRLAGHTMLSCRCLSYQIIASLCQGRAREHCRGLGDSSVAVIADVGHERVRSTPPLGGTNLPGKPAGHTLLPLPCALQWSFFHDIYLYKNRTVRTWVGVIPHRESHWGVQ